MYWYVSQVSVISYINDCVMSAEAIKWDEYKYTVEKFKCYYENVKTFIISEQIT